MHRLALLALLGGCTAYELGELETVQEKEDFKDIPVHENRDLDILFVIDDSCSMEEEQAKLAANFEVFMNVLETIEGGLPNLHLGVVSSNLGTGPVTVPGCDGDGDRGELRVGDASCRPQGAPFIIDVAERDGTRTRNYAGTLSEAFACNATLGIEGCGFEQHLESMRRALDGSNLENNGFLRDDAFLAVVIIADEDDCSTFDPEMFRAGSSYTCFEHGVECGAEGCAPREDSAFMYGVEEYVDFLKSLKPDPSMVLVSVIAGDAEPVVVADGALVPSCESSSGTADPAVRLGHFGARFPNRNTFTSICEEDLSGGMALFAEMIKETLGVPCLEGDLMDVDPDAEGLQFECVASEIVHPGTNEQDETLLPYCPAGTDHVLPCWRLVEDPAACVFTPTGMRLEVERSGASVVDTHLQLRCRTE